MTTKQKNSQLNAEIDEFGPNLLDLNAEIDEFGPNLLDLNAEIDEFGPNLLDLNAEIDEFGPNLLDLNAEIDEFGPNLLDLNAEINEFGPNLLDLNAEIDEFGPNFLDLPPEMLVHAVSSLSPENLKSFGLVNNQCNEIYQLSLNAKLRKCVDLRQFFHLKEQKVLERIKNLNYKSLNLNQCYYLSPGFITELVSKNCVRELDLTECNCTPEVIEAVAKLNLTSLNISLSKQWREYFFSKENKSVLVLNGLKKLEIFHRYRSMLLMSHVALYVLPHCQQLQSLKLFTPKRLLTAKNEISHDFQALELIPTPVPDLQSLVFDFHNYDDLFPHIKSFFEIILRKKTVPITNIDLGNQTVTALLIETINLKNIVSFENTDTLRLDCYSVINTANANHMELDVESVIKSMPKCTKYKKIYAQNFYIPNCSNFTDIFTKSGNTSIEEINLNKCVIKSDICYFIDTISVSNPGITYLDISLAYWPVTLINNSQLSNSGLMNSLANLTNLRTLCIVPAMLSQSMRKDEDMLKASFYKVTKMCKFLENLRIVEKRHITYTYIRQDVLSYIKFFQHLKQLYLVNFSLEGSEHSVLVEIAKHCSKLKHLHVKSVSTDARLDKMFLHAKRITHLYLDHSFKLTTTFVDNLCECSQLEKLYLTLSPKEDVQMLKYFALCLRRFKKLQFLSTKHLDILLKDYFMEVYKEIKDRRPNVCFDNRLNTKIPMAHHEFFFA